MKLKIMAKTLAFVSSLLGWKEVQVDGEEKKLKLTAEERKRIDDALGKDLADQAINNINSEIKQMADENLQLKAIQDEIAAMVEESELSEEQLQKIAKDEGNGNLTAGLKAIQAKQKEMEQTIAKLLTTAEDDSPEEIIKNANTNGKVQHSKTHLFGTNKAYDSFEDRSWNKRAAGHVSAATNFVDQPTIEKLNGDLELYYRENPEEIKSLHRDTFGLPDFWKKRTKVDDKVADATISTAEISQARKLPWLPKNKQTIKAEEGQIFPIQIDIEFIGYFLQKIEASWLNMMNKEGSQAYKTSFVKFLVSEIDKQARLEDRQATIKGVYVETPEHATVPGRFINRQNGLLYLAQQARDVTKKYRPFDLGLPTTVNIVDYVDEFIKSLPNDIRTQNGLVFYMSDYWLKAYKRRYEQIHGMYNNYEGYPTNPKDYANVKFQVLHDMEGSDFMFLTFDDNIEILENVPAEKALYHFEYSRRKIYVFADYKLGVRFIHIGNKIAAGDPDEFAVQTLWSNTAPVFPSEFYIPVHDDESGEIKVNFKNMYVSKDWKTDVTKFENATPGSTIKVKGDTSLTGNPKVKHSADLSLAGNEDFDLKSGGTLTLLVLANGKFKELTRTNAPATKKAPEAKFDAEIIDANEGSEFKYSGDESVTVSDIINGVEGKVIKIYGTNAANVDVKVATTDSIKVTAQVVLGAADKYLELIYTEGVWYEMSKSV